MLIKYYTGSKDKIKLAMELRGREIPRPVLRYYFSVFLAVENSFLKSARYCEFRYYSIGVNEN
jgi:hypothetical protein